MVGSGGVERGLFKKTISSLGGVAPKVGSGPGQEAECRVEGRPSAFWLPLPLRAHDIPSLRMSLGGVGGLPAHSGGVQLSFERRCITGANRTGEVCAGAHMPSCPTDTAQVLQARAGGVRTPSGCSSPYSATQRPMATRRKTQSWDPSKRGITEGQRTDAVI